MEDIENDEKLLQKELISRQQDTIYICHVQITFVELQTQNKIYMFAKSLIYQFVKCFLFLRNSNKYFQFEH